MNELYETRITTVRWLVYDLAGNAGWITWVVCTILCIKQDLTLGGIAGIPVSIIGLIVRSNGRLPLWMLVGAVLCAVFAGLCFKGYRKQK